MTMTQTTPRTPERHGTDGACRLADTLAATRAISPLGEEELERMTLLFREERRMHGARRAIRAWVDGPFDEWMRVLDAAVGCDGPCGDPHGGEGEMEPMSRDGTAALAVGMAGSLSIRDALIVSLVSGRACDRTMMAEIASQPHSDRVRRRMSRMMTEAFHGGGAPDFVRCSHGVALLERLVDAVPARWRVQPVAAIAYALWWMDDDLAGVRAAECVTADGECSLAGIVLSLVDRGIRPAWCG